MSDTVLGSALLGSTLGPIPMAIHTLVLLHKEAGVKLLLKGEVQPHQIFLKGHVHYLLTQWMELILHQICLCHT
jgi:hypothetical protein